MFQSQHPSMICMKHSVDRFIMVNLKRVIAKFLKKLYTNMAYIKISTKIDPLGVFLLSSHYQVSLTQGDFDNFQVFFHN